MKNNNAVTSKSGRGHLREVPIIGFRLGKKFGVLDRMSLMGGGRLREVVAHGGSTV